jgi:hypothetical protein
MPRKYHVYAKGAYIGTVDGVGRVNVWAPPPRA